MIRKTSPAPILSSDVKNIRTLKVNSKGISSLNGIEYFTALIKFICSYNQLTTLYSIKNTWDASSYKTQYTDSTHKTTTDSLVITIKN